MEATMEATVSPRYHPTTGMRNWKEPKLSDTLKAALPSSEYQDAPVLTETAKASMERPTEMVSISRIPNYSSRRPTKINLRLNTKINMGRSSHSTLGWLSWLSWGMRAC
jgi:hypothetical protein